MKIVIDINKCDLELLENQFKPEDVITILKRIILDGKPLDKSKIGKWIDHEHDFSGHCSLCGWETHLYEDYVFGMPFCPNCGACMEVWRGEDDETSD